MTSKTMKKTISYDERLKISTFGDDNKRLFTKTGKLLITGYRRIVVGARGPYVECELSQLNGEILREVAEKHYYYLELRSIPDDVKVYVQIQRVNYADYLPGLCYVSPFELFDELGTSLIDPLNSKLRQ